MESFQPNTPVNEAIPTPGVPTPIVQTPKKRFFDPRYLFIILIIIGVGGGFMIANKKPAPTPIPTPIDTPTPTPKTKTVVPIATQSAYIELVNGVASLSASINALQITDTAMTPPTVEIPLGFPN